MTNKYVIPSKILIYLKRIATEYQTTGHDLHARIIQSASISVHEEAGYDNWNGGMYGHDIIMFLPPEVFGEVTLARKADFEADLRSKLQQCCSSIANEYINAVRFEDEDENDPYFQSAISISDRPQLNPNSLSIWKSDHIRLFISHRDVHKVGANQLANLLEEFGISSFVAHDTIEPMATWQNEIVKGLETMEIMLVYLTDEFHESVWTNQEIGFALGRNIPIISLKLGKTDPKGFIGERQALKLNPHNMQQTVLDIYKLISEKLGNKHRLQTALIRSFCNSPDFSETKKRFERINSVVETLTSDEVAEISKAFNENTQLHNAGHLVSKYNRLAHFLNRVTGKFYEVSGQEIKLIATETEKTF